MCLRSMPTIPASPTDHVAAQPTRPSTSSLEMGGTHRHPSPPPPLPRRRRRRATDAAPPAGSTRRAAPARRPRPPLRGARGRQPKHRGPRTMGYWATQPIRRTDGRPTHRHGPRNVRGGPERVNVYIGYQHSAASAIPPNPGKDPGGGSTNQPAEGVLQRLRHHLLLSVARCRSDITTRREQRRRTRATLNELGQERKCRTRLLCAPSTAFCAHPLQFGLTQRSEIIGRPHHPIA